MKFLLFCLGAYLFLALLLYLTQRQFTYFPQRFSPEKLSAGVDGLKPVELSTEDGLTLTAWYARAKKDDLPTILYLHGNAGHIGHRVFLVRPYLEEGYGVLLLTYRGYSGNPGSPSEQGLYDDARAAMEFLRQKGVPQNLTVLFGESIGGAVAVQIAIESPVGAIVLQSPFTSLGDVGQYHYPIFPVKWLVKDKFDTLSKAPKIVAPVLIVLGEKDDIIPPLLSRELFEAFPGPKEMVSITDKGHNDLFEPERVIRFIKEYVH